MILASLSDCGDVYIFERLRWFERQVSIRMQALLLLGERDRLLICTVHGPNDAYFARVPIMRRDRLDFPVR